MSDFVLSCCTTADLDKAHYDRRDIRYLCFHFLMDGTSHLDDPTDPDLLPRFYQAIRNGAQPTTAQVNIEEFLQFFEPLAKEGRDILHISFSSGLSGSYNSATIAARQIMEKYPKSRIIVVDSVSASSGYGLLMDYIADKRDSGATLEETAAYAEELKLHIHHWFFSTDLTSYIRGGRVSKTAGFVGQVLGICPLLNMDTPGHLIPREKVRTKRRVKQTIVERMLQHAENGADYSGKCYISHSDCPEDARDVAELVEKTFPALKGKIEVYSIGTTIGSHTGIGTVALFFKGDLRAD